jgi:single-strand DNA-binding protein
MLNQVALVGRLTADIELRTTQSGISSASFTVAVTRDRKNQNGEYDSDFIRVVAWRQTAEFLSNYASKGALVSVSGRIQTGSYENAQGQRVYTTDVVADSVNLLESRATREAARGNAGSAQAQSFGGGNNNFQQQAPAAPSPSYGNSYQEPAGGAISNGSAPVEGRQMNISDDDLPF